MTHAGWKTPAVADRTFPFVPRSARQLQQGDLIAVPCEPSGWAGLQVVEVKQSGVGSVKNFVAGALPWFGEDAPTRRSVRRLAAVPVGLTRTEIFTDAGCSVVGNAPVKKTRFDSHFGPKPVGTVLYSWGWQAALDIARDVALQAR